MYSNLLILCMSEKRADTSWGREFLPFLMTGFYIDFIRSFIFSMILFGLFLGLFQFGLLSLCSSLHFFGEFDLIFIYFIRIFLHRSFQCPLTPLFSRTYEMTIHNFCHRKNCLCTSNDSWNISSQDLVFDTKNTHCFPCFLLNSNLSISKQLKPR